MGRLLRLRLSLLALSFAYWYLGHTRQASVTVLPRPASRLSSHLFLAHEGRCWTKARAPQLPRGIRIAFQVRDTGEFGIRTDEPCYNNPEDAQRGWHRTARLPPTLTDVRSARRWEAGVRAAGGGRHNATPAPPAPAPRGGRLLDFTTAVATDLKILFLGDSVAAQFGRAFDAAATGVPDAVALAAAAAAGAGNATALPPSPRATLARFGAGRDCVFASGPVRGGGVVALWRVVKLLSRARENAPTCNHAGGGWNAQQLASLLRHRYAGATATDRRLSPSNATPAPLTEVESFDAVVLRIQLGWMAPRHITHEGIIETINLCHTLLGAETVVIMTINFTNDVHNSAEWRWAAEMNNWIREQARTMNREATAAGQRRRVLVLEFSDFTTQVHWANARTIRAPEGGASVYEYPDLAAPDVSLPGYELATEARFLFDRFKPWHAMNKHPHSIPTVCSRMGTPFIHNKEEGFERRTCERNAIMADGLHWCMSSVGPRYHAGLSCLLGCVYNVKGTEYEGGNGTSIEMEPCERACNAQFMSLRPIEESWMEHGNTLYSVPGL